MTRWVWDDLDVPPPTQRAWVAAVLIFLMAVVLLGLGLTS
jgi:hypothetical protein